MLVSIQIAGVLDYLKARKLLGIAHLGNLFANIPSALPSVGTFPERKD